MQQERLARLNKEYEIKQAALKEARAAADLAREQEVKKKTKKKVTKKVTKKNEDNVDITVDVVEEVEVDENESKE